MEYRKVRIEDVCNNICSGGTPKSNNNAYYENGNIPWLNTKEVNFNYIYNTEKRITNEGLINSAAKIIDENNVIVAMYGATAGRVAINKIKLSTNQACCNLKINESIANYIYVYYYLKMEYKKLADLANGGAQQNLNSLIIKNFEIYLPNLDIQNKIAKILFSLDKKIELNNKINDNLHELIKNEYDEKFINNKKNLTKKMSVLVEKTIGGDWGKELLNGNYNSEVLCIRGADIPEMDSGNKGKAPNRFILEKNLKVKQLHGEEIIIEISGGSPTQATGRCTYITHELEKSFEKPIICTNFCRAIKLKENKYLPSFYMNLKYLYSKNIMFLYENGTTGIKNLDLPSLLENEDINLVEDKIIIEFNELFYSINKKIIQNANENRILEQLRDTLLPKLMNGELNLDKLEI